MNRYEILIVGTNSREVSFCVHAANIIAAWSVVHEITSQIAYIGYPLTLNIREI